MKFVVNFKKIGSWVLQILTPLGVTPKDKDLGLDKPYLVTHSDHKLDLWMKSYLNLTFVFIGGAPRSHPLTCAFTTPTCVLGGNWIE